MSTRTTSAVPIAASPRVRNRRRRTTRLPKSVTTEPTSAPINPISNVRESGHGAAIVAVADSPRAADLVRAVPPAPAARPFDTPPATGDPSGLVFEVFAPPTPDFVPAAVVVVVDVPRPFAAADVVVVTEPSAGQPEP